MSIENKFLDVFRVIENKFLDVFRVIENKFLDVFSVIENKFLDVFRVIENKFSRHVPCYLEQNDTETFLLATPVLKNCKRMCFLYKLIKVLTAFGSDINNNLCRMYSHIRTNDGPNCRVGLLVPRYKRNVVE